MPQFDTPLSAEEENAYGSWKEQYAPKDSGEDYDFRGAFRAGISPAENGHWPDTFKKPNHPTFSVESQYADQAPERAGAWDSKGNYLGTAAEAAAARTRRGAAHDTGNYGIPTISSPEEAEKLRPGQQFKGPDGSLRSVPYKVMEPSDINNVPDGADFVGPDGELRVKPKYESIDFTAQYLYNVAHSDKGRRKALERSYPGKVRDDPAGGFFVEDDDGVLRKPGRGAAASGGGIASAAAPTALGIGGAVGGGVFGGVPGVAGAFAGGAAGSKVNDIVSSLAGVYDDENAWRDAAIEGGLSAGGQVAGKVIGAGARVIGEAVSGGKRVLPSIANNMLGTDPEALKAAIPLAEKGATPGKFGLKKAGTEVPPSQIFKESPAVQNIVEFKEPALHTQEPLKLSREAHYERSVGEILEGVGVGKPMSRTEIDRTFKEMVAAQEAGNIPLVEKLEDVLSKANTRSATHPGAAVSVEAAGDRILESVRAKSAASDQRLRELLELRKADAERRSGILPPVTLPESWTLSVNERVPRNVFGEAVHDKPVYEFKVGPFEMEIAPVEKGGNKYWVQRIERGRDIDPTTGASTESEKGHGPAVYQRVADFLAKRNAKLVPGAGPPSDYTLGGKKLKDSLSQNGMLAADGSVLPSSAPRTSQNARLGELRQAQEESQRAAQGLIDQGFTDLDRQSADALRVARAGHNSGDLWRSVGEQLNAYRTGIQARARTMYDTADELSGAVRNGDMWEGGARIDASSLAPRAQAFLDQLPEEFIQNHGPMVQRIRALGNSEEAPTWAQLHDLRTQLRQNIKWNDLTSDVKNGTYKYFNNRVNELLLQDRPETREAVAALNRADTFYRTNMGPLGAKEIQNVMNALDSGLQADPKALLNVIMKEGKTEVAQQIERIVGPNTWNALRAADTQEMIQGSRDIMGNVDSKRFAREVLKRQNQGLLDTLHGPQARGLVEQAQRIEQLAGRVPITAQPGDTVSDVIMRARAAADAAKEAAKKDPLNTLKQEMNELKKHHAAEMKATNENNPLAFMLEPKVGAHEAVNRILSNPDLLIAASKAFPGAEASPEFELIRQVWVQRFFEKSRTTLRPAKQLEEVTPEIQSLMFPGVSIKQMHLFAKEMELLRQKGSDGGKGIMKTNIQENPLGAASGLGKLAGPAKIIPGANMGARKLLGDYYALVRHISTSPSTLRWLEKGLTASDPVDKEAARAAMAQIAQRAGTAGAGIGAGLGMAGPGAAENE